MLSLVPVRQLRIGIVGYTLGRIHYGAVLTHSLDLRVVGIVDMDVKSTRAWSRELPGKPPLFPVLSSLLSAVEDIDLLVIAVPLHERGELIAQALNAGRSVLSDFPFAASLADNDKLIELAANRGVSLLPLLPRRYDPWFEQVAEMVRTGLLGEVKHVRYDWTFPLGLGFALENGVALDQGGWHELLRAVAVQTVDICLWWLGSAESVSADIDLPAPGVPDAIVRRDASDPVANIIVGHTNGQSTHLLSRSRATLPGERCVISGSDGHLELVVTAGETASTSTAPSLTLFRSGLKPENVLPDTLDYGSVRSLTVERIHRLMAGILREFTDSIIPAVSAGNAGAALEVVDAAYLSARERTRIALPLRRASDSETVRPRK